jgi:hypothetical protein
VESHICVAIFGGRRYFGEFQSEVDAALAYDQAARYYRADKAQLNFPDLPPPPDDDASEGASAFPPSQPGPGWEPPPPLPESLADCLTGDALGGRDTGPGQTPSEQSMGELEGPPAHEDVGISHDPTTPGASFQHRGEPRRMSIQGHVAQVFAGDLHRMPRGHDILLPPRA